MNRLQTKQQEKLQEDYLQTKSNQWEKDKIFEKKWIYLTLTKSQVNKIFREKYSKPLKVRKVFYLNEVA